MPSIQRTIHIRAKPDAVFDLISRVEDFSRYTQVIKQIERIEGNTYRWRISVAGFELDWDAAVTELRRPSRLTWESIRGIENCGSFDLKPDADGTEIRFTMAYRLPNVILEKIVDTIAAPIMQRVASEILEQVRSRLEPPRSSSGQ